MLSNGNLHAIEELAEQTIPDCFEEAVRRFKDQPALYDRDRVMTFNDLDRSCANSLLATMIVNRLSRAFGVEPPVALVFDRPTVAEIATFLSREN